MENGWKSLSGELRQEMQLIYDKLIEMTEDLESPLRELVYSQVNSAQPYLRAGVVLSAGYEEPDTATLQAARVNLAAAIEMLYVALSIHGLLMPYDGDSRQADPNKTVLGSTVLAGDYCFSQSAIMAARTENPGVVAIFAKALQDVSESQLRQIFDLKDAPEQTNLILFQAGASAAARLRQVAATVETELVTLSRRFASCVQTQGNLADMVPVVEQATFPAPLKTRWLQITHLA